MERRRFLSRTAVLAAGTALAAGPFQGVAAHLRPDGPRRPGRGYGPLRPVRDLRDGQVRLHLPEGFRYRSFNPAGSRLGDGTITPGRHDGMAAFRGPRGSVILVRNHEVNGPVGAFGDPAAAYDPMAGGGTCTLRVTPYGEVLDSRVSLNGTQMNCSGGPMPWGSWITCEETVNGPDVGNDFSGGDNSRLRRRHGYLFEVPAAGRGRPAPIRAAGRFAHEAAAYDARTGAVYLTEDNFGFPSGFYRYLPPKNPMAAGRLLDGGRLQMLAVRGRPNADLSQGQPEGAVYETTWVDIDDPDPAFTGTPSNNDAIQAVGMQGRAKGAALFSRLEGAIADRGVVYFVSTQGGAPVTQPVPSGFGDGRGQVWAYDTRSGRLRLVVESPGDVALDLPDNITHSPRGTLVLCEDGGGDNYLRGLTVAGELFDFARLEPVPEDDGAEFAGSTFAPGGGTLFVNVQTDAGLSFAIWGPWRDGPF
ncbi:PhoX family protein [Thermomonospora cellulosilytica]|uniref:Secreted PhoX family phosphatase n=1 Tax=Thermomonospora cellulosilytica TaxID=1411118 RepID=A0A7W3MSU6_9ACTN|nr:alkaline phosphatase PhoX [Thermomonospora cellulosilytica]MBA9001253.1 secreted PhoX family phosphatase [Thermomonospora cellulosilytica]